jgi:anthranilate/para-aminobenzoate synthase component II
VYEKDAPHVDPEVFNLQVPILGICYGLQEIAWHHGKNVLAGEKKEYGHAKLNIERHTGKAAHIDTLFDGIEENLEVGQNLCFNKSDLLISISSRYGCLTETSYHICQTISRLSQQLLMRLLLA